VTVSPVANVGFPIFFKREISIFPLKMRTFGKNTGHDKNS
jgi:hypothetical protein